MSKDREAIPGEEIVAEATFNPKVKIYWLLSGAVVFVATIVGIPLLPFWFLIGMFVTQRYLDRMSCTLTTRSLRVRKGMLNRVQKIVPLEKITDMSLVQGPIMRAMDLEAISVETAGQSSQGSLIRLVGINETRKFRDAVLAQREILRQASDRSSAAPVTTATDGHASRSDDRLDEIRDILVRIESHLKRNR